LRQKNFFRFFLAAKTKKTYNIFGGKNKKLRRWCVVRASRAEIVIEEILQDNDMIFEEEYIFPGLTADNGKPLRPTL
jgi:hypothetical protein